MKVYVASSWRNRHQQHVVGHLRDHGYSVYDFRNPEDGDRGFHWSEIDPDWQRWNTESYRASLDHELARDGFQTDMEALEDADAVVLVLPCGRSSHLELGWAIGNGKHGLILIPNSQQVEPELMYKMATVCIDLGEVREELARRALCEKGR